jgi:hypothetical protein
VADRALGSGEHRVVVGEDRTGRRLIREELAIHPRGPADQAVGRGALDQVLQLAAAPLRRYRVPPVLDEAAGIDQVADVLPRRAAAGLVPPSDGILTRLVLGQPAPAQQLGEVLADLLAIGTVGDGGILADRRLCAASAGG